MLHLIPAPLHRLAYRLAHAARKLWWRWRKPRIDGCRVLALDPDGRVLLVRHTYGSRKWLLPGGGLAKGESAFAAAARELREETTCSLIAPVELAVIHENLNGAANCVHIVAGRAGGTPVADLREILEAAFFAADRLPEAMPVQLRAELPHWIAAATAARLGDGAAPPSRPPAPKA